MSEQDKPLVWLDGGINTPPFSDEARREAGFLLRMLQEGETLRMPQSRPMSRIGRRCHELRINDKNQTWRIMYRLDEDAVVLLDISSKKTNDTPNSVIELCKKRLKDYDAI